MTDLLARLRRNQLHVAEEGSHVALEGADDGTPNHPAKEEDTPLGLDDCAPTFQKSTDQNAGGSMK